MDNRWGNGIIGIPNLVSIQQNVHDLGGSTYIPNNMHGIDCNIPTVLFVKVNSNEFPLTERDPATTWKPVQTGSPIGVLVDVGVDVGVDVDVDVGVDVDVSVAVGVLVGVFREVAVASGGWVRVAVGPGV